MSDQPAWTSRKTEERQVIEIAVLNVPDIAADYTSLTIRPASVALTYVRKAGTAWSIERAVLSGPRVLKSGDFGQTTHDHEFWFSDFRPVKSLPEWLDEAIAFYMPDGAA